MEVCPLYFRFGEHGCEGPSKCVRGHHSESIWEKKGVCFKDYFQKGSCNRSDKDCWFSHETPDELRSHHEFRMFMERKKDEKSVLSNKKKSKKKGKTNVSTSSDNDSGNFNLNKIDQMSSGRKSRKENRRKDGNKNTDDNTKKSNKGQSLYSSATQNPPFLYQGEPHLDMGRIIHLIQEQVQLNISNMFGKMLPQSNLMKSSQDRQHQNQHSHY